MIEKVFILHHTHVDIGYTGDRDKVCDDLVAMVDQVTDLVRDSASRPGPQRFRWIHEVSWPVLEYLRRGGARQAELFDQVRSGLVELTALYVNPTDLFDHDTFELSIDRACQLAAEQHLPLNVAMFSDCPGIPWSVVDILATRGIRYLSASPDFIMSYPLEVERPFYWEGPGGHRLLTWFSDWRNCWYAEGLFALKLHQDPAEATTRLLDYIQNLQGEGYRWQGLAVHVAMDNHPPIPQLLDFVDHFNEHQAGVTATLATNADFFEFMESHHRDQFAVHRGAWPDWWANGNASAAYEVACSRRAKTSLRRSAAFARLHNIERDSELLGQATESILMFDEHTWGSESSVRDPWGLHARTQWTQKRLLATSVLEKARRLEDTLARQIAEPDRVAVANPFDMLFAGPVSLASDGSSQAPTLRDVATGEQTIGQRSRPDDTAGDPSDCYILTLAPRMLRTFERIPRKRAASRPPSGMENDHFRIEYDSATGAVGAVFDKLAQRPLCDSSAPWSFAELVHERVRQGSREAIYDIKYSATDPEAKRPRPDFVRLAGHAANRRVKLVAGPVFNSLLTLGRLPGVRFVREIRLFHGLHRIEILLRLDKQIVTDYESLYLAFPFAANPPQVWIENAGAVYRAGVEQLPGSATDWLSLGEYAAVSDGLYTAVLAPHDVPLVQVGDIHTGKWAKRLDVRSGQLYSWIMNNVWFTNFPAYQEGIVKLGWSVTGHVGPFDATAATSFAHTARVGVLSPHAPPYPQ